MECPICEKGKMIKKKTKYMYNKLDFGGYDALVCNKCGETFFTEESSLEIEKKAKKLGIWGMEKKSKISYAGSSLIVRIPKSIAKVMRLTKGKDILIRPEGKKKLVVSLEST
ncbi:MAG: AbrB/MazE/SpoVT family DNA-binding domain-containing protein [Candidatus Thermoplasmatota archaeon]|nr:AbrB/MazE/SpoVT family DNA-binding domain-containing protein [Candidatus Thermoplasmatota archaeon]MBU4190596.1 AbrB/MazE/SpoVT family DNA-binding domain-containing protein [Candidatus Thermoplasmatota archaeon]